MIYKKVFIDSDIILDLIFQRQPFFKYSQVLFDGVFPEYELTTSALILANVHYLIRKHVNKATAKDIIKNVTDILKVFPFEKQHILLAVSSDHSDFEDSIQYHIAMQNKCDFILTRNLKDYKHSTIPVLTAEQFLRTIL
ncbi:PIN domain-containing protein [Mucilaginibacter mali]|uniref:PIN domain-containing protein n=1 Tax=Mucilaginibacter mali TaxID=2740462 RepID=A0A7D4UNH7_9SPHI|nr:PIN domain-containing protein [Mucilaginibacter mali]QKJ31981.1 PIN domain-containing protein [Mucilaginibacter mali]